MTAEHSHLPAEGEIRIGVYVCHCGSNIAGVVDVAEVARWAAENLTDQGVVVARDYKFMCSSPGQELVDEDIKELRPEPDRGGGLLAAPPREDLPHGHRHAPA